MRALSIGKLMALAVSFAMPSPAAAQSSPPFATAGAAIQGGKAEVNVVLYHYLLAKRRSEPVILLYGWGSTSYMWRYVLPQLVEKRSAPSSQGSDTMRRRNAAVVERARRRLDHGYAQTKCGTHEGFATPTDQRAPGMRW